MSIIHGSAPCKPSALLLDQDRAIHSTLFSASLKSVGESFSSIGEAFRSKRSLGNIVTHPSLKLLEREKVDQRSFVKVLFTCMAIAAALGLIKVVRHWVASDEVMKPQDTSSENALTTALAVTSAQVGRRLLSSAMQSLLPNLIATEEVPFSVQHYVWDFFKNTDGSRISVSAKQTNGLPLPSGLSLINQLMNIAISTPLPSIGKCIAYSNGYTFIGTVSQIMIFNASNPLNPLMVFPISVQNPIAMSITGNLLYMVESIIVDGYVYPIFRVIDVSDLSNPINKGFLRPTTDLKGGFASLDNFIYLGTVRTTSTPSALAIIDVLDPTNPIFVGSASLSTVQYFDSIALSNNNICYAASDLGFHSFNVSNSSNPTILGYLIMSPEQTNRITCLAASNDNNIFFAGTKSNGIQIIDVSNPSTPFIHTIVSGGNSVSVIKKAGNFLFVGTQDNLVQKYDITNPRNPILVSSVLTGKISSLGISQMNVYISVYTLIGTIEVSALVISTLGDLFSIRGIPAGNTQGNYSIELTATSLNDSVTEKFNLEINPAITLKDKIPPLKAIVGSNFNYFVQAFSQINNAPLTYAAKRINGSVPSWLTLNSISSTISGTPAAADAGTLNLQLIATDSAGSVALADCQIRVLNGPTLNSPIPNQLTTIGNPYNFTLNANTFINRDGYPLTYAATSEGETLPSWLTFNPSTQTFSGIPSSEDGGIVTITVTAGDLTNITIPTNFQLNIVTELPPALFNPISNQVATVGEAFKFVIPKNTFTDAYADEITYSVKSSDGSPFPTWLSYDPASRTFSGTPSFGDTNSFEDRILQITLNAKGIRASQSTIFTINVTGTSAASLALMIAGPVATVASVSYTAYKIRYLFWNTFRKSKYQKPAETAIIGKPYVHKLVIPSKEIGAIEVSQNKKKFPAGQSLPYWLYFDHKNNSLKSDCIPADDHLEAPLCLRIVDRQGFNREEFDLLIKDESEAPLIAEEKVARSSKVAGTRLKERNDSIGSHYVEMHSMNG